MADKSNARRQEIREIFTALLNGPEGCRLYPHFYPASPRVVTVAWGRTRLVSAQNGDGSLTWRFTLNPEWWEEVYQRGLVVIPDEGGELMLCLRLTHARVPQKLSGVDIFRGTFAMPRTHHKNYDPEAHLEHESVVSYGGFALRTTDIYRAGKLLIDRFKEALLPGSTRSEKEEKFVKDWKVRYRRFDAGPVVLDPRFFIKGTS